MLKYFILALALSTPTIHGLRCYICDNVGFGEECITEPELVAGGSTECQTPNDEYCFTSRLEEDGGEKITFNRGCCRVKEGSPVCPLGDSFQIIENVDYTRYLTRCGDSLCNDSEGLNGGGSGNNGGGSIIVPGAPSTAHKTTAYIGSLGAMAVIAVLAYAV